MPCFLWYANTEEVVSVWISLSLKKKGRTDREILLLWRRNLLQSNLSQWFMPWLHSISQMIDSNLARAFLLYFTLLNQREHVTKKEKENWVLPSHRGGEHLFLKLVNLYFLSIVRFLRKDDRWRVVERETIFE